MKIIDNFMINDWWKHTHDILDGHDFPWYLYKQTSDVQDAYQQMVHIFYRDNRIYSNWFNMLQPMVYELERQTIYKVKNVDRIKSNLLFNRSITDEQKFKVIHQDMEEDKYISLIYYIKDSDGDTILYEDDRKTEVLRIQPKANRAVIFDSRTWHTGELPVENQSRIVISCIFKVL